MKKRARWTATPLFFIFSAVMLIMAVLSYSYNKVIFYTEIGLSVLSVLLIIFLMLKTRKYIFYTVRSAAKGVLGENRDFLNELRFPVAVAGINGDLLWYNSTFKAELSSASSPCGISIEYYLGGNSVYDVFSRQGLDISFNNNRYSVFASETSESIIFYFINDTKLKNVFDEYNNSRPCVATIVFDNKEEIERDSEDDSANAVLAPLEALIIKWATSNGGVYKKTSGNKYFVLFEEKHFLNIVAEKFKILDEVRALKSSQGTSVTISIGVGRCGSNLKEAEMWSRKALEMALGRGGDQAVVKAQDDYKFFGGVSQGVERRDKVRTRVISAAISEKISASDMVFIMGHRYSDLDCIGSAAGLYHVITKEMKKKASIVVKSSQSPATPLINILRNNASDDEEMFIEPADAVREVTNNSLLIIVDTHSAAFLESDELYNKEKNVIVIDHHRMMVNYIQNAAVFYHEPFASSASEMTTELIQYMGDKKIPKHIAEALMAGIMLDTKNFSIKTASRTFEASAYLCRNSADTVNVKHLFANSLDEYKARSELVFNATQIGKCAVACTEKYTKNIRVTAAQAADELLNIQNVDASFVIYPTDDTVSISARSLGRINVQLIMEALGGGGHLTMAAVQLKYVSVSQAREMLEKELKKLSE